MNKMKCLGKKGMLTLSLMLSLGCLKAQEIKDTLTLTLDEVLEVALSDNPTIQVADKEIELKRESKRDAYAGLFPEVSLSGTYQRNIKPQTMGMTVDGKLSIIQMGTDNTYPGGIQVGLPIFAPALYKTINLTKTDVELAVEKARASELDLVNQVTKAYYQLLMAQDSYAVLQKSYRQAEENFNVVNEKFKQGVVSEYDKIRADVQMRNLVPSVVSAKNSVNLAKLQLKVLMAVDPDMEIAIVGNLKDYELQLFGELLERNPIDLDDNSDLKQLNLNAELLDKTLKIQNTNFMPSLTASYYYGYMALNNDFRVGHYRWNPHSTAGISLTVPLFKATNFTKVKQTKIQKLQLGHTRENLVRQLNMQATSYMNNMDASSEQVVSNKESIIQAEKGREIAQKRYDVGRGTILELNDSELALTQAELAYCNSIYDYLIAKADLDKVLGVGIE